MEPHDAQQKIARATRQIGAALDRQAHQQWETVRTARRNEGRRQVWRFRYGPEGTERFLHIDRASLARGTDPARRVLARLDEAGWLERLQRGPETSFRLSGRGSLEPWPKA